MKAQRRSDDGPGRQSRPAAIAVAAFVAACGPEAAEKPEPQAWMLGTFSPNPPGEYLDIYRADREHILEGGRARTEEVTEQGVRPILESVWRVVDESTFNYYADSFDDPQWWEVTQADGCSLDLHSTGVQDGIRTTWYRGTMCYESLTQPCPPEQAQCGTKARLYWCEEPPPCDDE